MKLREWDTNQPNQGAWIEREYPDGPIQEFCNWFRNTRQWRESPEMAYQRWLKFERELADARNAGLAPVAGSETATEGPGGSTETVRPTCSATTKAGAPCKGKAVQDGLCASHMKQAQAA